MIYFKKYFIFYFFIFFTTNSYSEIYYIDIDRILNSSSTGKILNNKILDYQKKIFNDFEIKKKKLFDIEENLKIKKNIINETEYKSLYENLQSEVLKFNEETTEYKKKLETMQITYRNKFLTLLMPILLEYAKDNNITHLVEKRFIIVGDNNFDLTEELIKVVNNKINLKMFNE